jgi:LacI family transcriptional regulator
MSTRVTAADIAVHLGLAKSTVTHVLSGRAEQLRISAATQARVHEAVRELGYRPNASARAVGSGRFGSAALIQPFEGVYLPTGLLMGITDELQRNDMHLVVSEVHAAGLQDADYLPKVVREVAADGLLINMMTSIPPRLLETLHSLNTPAVWINKRQPDDAVHPDDLHAGRWATEHLISLGHKRIAFMVSADIQRTDLHYSIYDRRQSYEAAMQEARLQPQILALPKVPHTMDEIRADNRLQLIAGILSSDQRPTAIVAYSSNIVLPVLQVAAQLGLQLPRDLSLVVFADTPSQEIGRPVTTVCLKMSSVGNEAVKMLLRKIQEPSQPQPSLPITPWFFQGNTSGPPP